MAKSHKVDPEIRRAVTAHLDQEAETIHPTPQQQHQVQQGVADQLGKIVPILKVEMRPTNVDPATAAGRAAMKRVLNVLLNDEGTQITVKDDRGRPQGAMTFRQIYPNLEGPRKDGSIQVEYHEQATLGFLGDVLWSLSWYFRNGFLGVPMQMGRAILKSCGVSFLLEEYYRRWLVSLLDQMNQQGLIPGYVDPVTKEDNWEVVTETAGQNIIVRPKKQ